jgi:hypothetical protein
MSNTSKLLKNTPTKLRMTNGMLSGMRPLAQIFSKNTISDASRSADVIVKVAFDSPRPERIGEERYFLLGDEYCVRNVLSFTNDHKFMERNLRQTVLDVGMTN